MAEEKKAKKVREVKGGPVLGSYCNLFTPRAADEDSEPKYSMSMLFKKKDLENPAHPTAKFMAELKRRCHEEAVIKFGADYAKKYPKFKLPFRDGDIEKPDKEEYAACIFANASGIRAPGVVNKARIAVTSESEAYSGCFYIVSVNPYPFDKKGNKGIALGLNNVMVWDRGPRIDGREDAAEAFKDWSDDESSTAGASSESALD